MSFNFSLNYDFLIQTSTYSHADYEQARPGQQLTTTVTSSNLKVTLYPVWMKHVVVEWSVPADWGGCLFYVYFSQTENDQFELINPIPINGTFLTDTFTEAQRKFNKGYYVVEAILTDPKRNNVAIRSPAHTWVNVRRDWVEIRAHEIQRRELFLLSHYNGVKSYLFRRKTYGERCPNCWDVRAEKLTQDHCPVCIGTSFKDGYFDPFTFYANYDATPGQTVKNYFGLFEPNNISAWTISMPNIQPDDIIMRTGDFAIYRVEEIAPTELLTKKVRQIMRLTELTRSDVENQLVTRNLAEFPSKYL